MVKNLPQNLKTRIQQVVFLGEISPNFDLKILIWIYTRIFHWKNDPNSPDFKKKKSFLIAKFL